MFYLFVWILLLIGSILQGFFYRDLNDYKDNHYHQIIDMWYKDPINEIQFLSPNSDCPQEYQQYEVDLIIQSSFSLCSCETEANQNSKYSNQQLVKCGTSNCQEGTIELTRFEAIEKQNLSNQYYEEDNKGTRSRKKLCINRIEGYAFVKKAPTSTTCDSDEKYCIWDSIKDDPEFGYCIPKTFKCYSQGIKIINEDFYKQLPLIEILYNFYDFQIQNLILAGDQTIQQIYDINLIKYPKQFIPFFEKITEYQQRLVTYPRVKMSCRDEFKTQFAQYKGYDFSLKVAKGLVIVTSITAAMGLFLAIRDIKEFYQIIIKKREAKVNYWLKKRYNLENSVLLNAFLILRPIVFLAAFVLYIEISNHYIVAQKQVKKMINDECVDLSLKYVLNYSSDFSESDMVREIFVYVPLAFQIFAFFSDQVFIQFAIYLADKLGIIRLFKKIFKKSDKQLAKINQIPPEALENINKQQDNSNQEQTPNATPQKEVDNLNTENPNEANQEEYIITPQQPELSTALQVQQTSNQNGTQFKKQPSQEIKVSYLKRKSRSKSFKQDEDLMLRKKSILNSNPGDISQQNLNPQIKINNEIVL